jgi:DNA-binding XRE family transcriptional regulator
MDNKRCEICGSRVSGGILKIDVSVFSEKFELKVLGENCTNPKCSYFTIVDDNGYINEKINMKRLDLIKKNKFVAITIFNLKGIRNMQGITQIKLSEVMGLTQQRIGMVEKNLHAPSINTVLKISKFLNVNLEDIYKIVLIKNEVYTKLKYFDKKLLEIEELKLNEFKLKDVELALKNIEKKLRNKKENYEIYELSKYFDKVVLLKYEIQEIQRQKEELNDLKHKLNKIITKQRENSILINDDSTEISSWQKIIEKFGKNIVPNEEINISYKGVIYNYAQNSF